MRYTDVCLWQQEMRRSQCCSTLKQNKWANISNFPRRWHEPNSLLLLPLGVPRSCTCATPSEASGPAQAFFQPRGLGNRSRLRLIQQKSTNRLPELIHWGSVGLCGGEGAAPDRKGGAFQQRIELCSDMSRGLHLGDFLLEKGPWKIRTQGKKSAVPLVFKLSADLLPEPWFKPGLMEASGLHWGNWKILWSL